MSLMYIFSAPTTLRPAHRHRQEKCALRGTARRVTAASSPIVWDSGTGRLGLVPRGVAGGPRPTASRVASSQTIADRGKRPPLFFLGALPVADVQRRHIIVLCCENRCIVTSPSPAEQDHRGRFGGGGSHPPPPPPPPSVEICLEPGALRIRSTLKKLRINESCRLPSLWSQ